MRRLAYEAADSGLLSPELAAGIRRVKGVKQLGARTGNWLTRDQAGLLLEKADGDDLRSLRDLAMISILLGCGLRRAELSALTVEDMQIRQGHWAIVDLVGKGGIAMLRSRNMDIELAAEAGASHGHFLQGITTEVLNPKTALFFLSFIPQFVIPARGHLISQFLLLGATSVSLNTAADMIVVALAGAVAHKLKNNPNFTRRQRTASGLGMIGLGTYVAVSK